MRPMFYSIAIILESVIILSFSFRILSRFEDQTETADIFAARWDDRGEEGGWLKESKKPEPDFFLASTITSLNDR